jgi:low molecular weight protein-tyrosine phosphatase
MIKILMVCLGNICRSPLAEGILQSKVNKNKVKVESAGTGGWHIGELPDPRSIEIAGHHHLDITNQKCRKFKQSDFDEFDIIYVMDRSNLRDVQMMARSEEDMEKVHLILDSVLPNQFKDVPDPYYDEDDGFEKVFQILENACENIANKLN